jgi:hypothetical protein
VLRDSDSRAGRTEDVRQAGKPAGNFSGKGKAREGDGGRRGESIDIRYWRAISAAGI